jgi:hypothetical protein
MAPLVSGQMDHASDEILMVSLEDKAPVMPVKGDR